MFVEMSDFCFCFWLICDKFWMFFKTMLLKSGLVSSIGVFGCAVVYIREKVSKVIVENLC